MANQTLTTADHELLAEARAAREMAYAPYSNFHVGAAIRTGDGRIFRGCNVENASYGLSICAERVAIGSAVAAGSRDVEACAVVLPDGLRATPCGACRQWLTQFNPQMRVLLVVSDGTVEVTTAAALLPGGFEL